MAYSPDKIISDVEKKYPNQDFKIKGITDIDIAASKKVLNQFIIGIASGNHGSSESISYYENWIKDQLSNISSNIYCLPWFFTLDEQEEMFNTLRKLAEYYNIDLDIESMMRHAKRKDVSGYFIVITVVQTPFISLQNE